MVLLRCMQPPPPPLRARARVCVCVCGVGTNLAFCALRRRGNSVPCKLIARAVESKRTCWLKRWERRGISFRRACLCCEAKAKVGIEVWQRRAKQQAVW